MDYPNRLIKEGETNKTIVKAIQSRLNELGCGPVEVVGIFGPKTISAVKLFQSTRKDQDGNPLTIDGKVGTITWAVLFGTENIPVVEETTNAILTEAVKIAATQIGVMEKPPGSNKGPEVNMYLASVGLEPGLYWCASFLYWCFDKAATNLGRNNPLVKTGGCLNHWNNTKGKKILKVDAVNNPSLLKPGQLFIIDHGGGAGHTGIIEKVDGGFIETIEGNSNPAGSANGIGVFRLKRKIATISKGFIEYK